MGSNEEVVEEWPGNYVLWCKGAIMVGPKYWAAIVTFVLMLVPYTLFIVFPIYYFSEKWTWFFLPFTIVVFLLTLASNVLTSVGDPGIMPRQSSKLTKRPYIPADLRKCGSMRNKVITYLGTRLTAKFCVTCYIYRPPRCSHCHICDHCVEKFDHHCPWTGGDIGKYNYRYYYIFINSLAFHLAYMALMCTLHLIFLTLDFKDDGYDDGKALQKALETSPMTPVVAAIAIGFMFFDYQLCHYHHRLIGGGLTTNEDYKDIYLSGQDSPFKREAYCTNLSRLFCRTLSKRMVNPDNMYKSEEELVLRVEDKEQRQAPYIMRGEPELPLPSPDQKLDAGGVPSAAPMADEYQGKNYEEGKINEEGKNSEEGKNNEEGKSNEKGVNNSQGANDERSSSGAGNRQTVAGSAAGPNPQEDVKEDNIQLEIIQDDSLPG